MLIFLFIFLLLPKNVVRTDLEPFASCIRDSGAKFYGAYWCTHCQDQKKMFGTAKNILPYVECSSSDGKSQTQICKDNNIQGYPTWIFNDGSTLNGTISLDELASKTNCPLPK